MRKRTVRPVVFISLLIAATIIFAQPQNPYPGRRSEVLDRMSSKGLLVIQTPREGFRYGYGFEQDSNLLYLTGMTKSGIILILLKTGIKSPVSNGIAYSILITDSPVTNRQDKKKYYRSMQDSLGIDLVCSLKELRKIFKAVVDIDVLYTNMITRRQQDTRSILEKRLVQLRDRFPDIEIKSPGSLTSSLRVHKSEQEIALMQQAVDITIAAHIEAFKSMQPGTFEYQVEAVIEYIFKYFGSRQLAFPTIVGSGPNSLDLHYMDGVRKIESGDMVVMDIGCEYDHYCADITRTIPANGKFTPQQKEIYNIVLEANETVINMLRPGVTMAQMDSTVRAIMTRYGYEKYIRHGCTHYLGLDVHDVGDRSKPFEPGVVVTVEPGLYIPKNSDLPEEYWNIGVRIEDDVLITEDGHRVLSAGCPKTVAEIEALMKLEGLGDIKFGSH